MNPAGAGSDPGPPGASPSTSIDAPGATGAHGATDLPGASPPTPEQLNAVLQGFDRLYGLEFVDLLDGEVRARVEVRDELLQPYGLVHGGVYASIAESITSLATAIGVFSEGMAAMGLANSTNFLRPVTAGAVNAQATRLHRGRTTWVWDVRFTDEHGRVCAVTRMTIAVRPMPEPPPPARAAPAA